MRTGSQHLHISSFRRHVCVWVVLVALSCSLLPSISAAQSPTATMSVVSGIVLVNGQAQGTGAVLKAGDIIETQAGAHTLLTLSDGSTLDVSENTKLDVATLAQTAAGARTSKVKIAWGRLRAKLSAGHQKAGSTFDIETPNALVGVKFSQPDVEVRYDLTKQETTGIAHTVELLVTNLLTGEKMVVPVGSTVVIAAALIKIAAGTAAVATAETGSATGATTGTAAGSATGTAAAGIGSGTMLAIGAGVVAAGGVTAAVVATSGQEEDDDSNPGFTGVFKRGGLTLPDGSVVTRSLHLTQQGDTITGTFSSTRVLCCAATVTVAVTGTVQSETSALLFWPTSENVCTCADRSINVGTGVGITVSAVLVDQGNILRISAYNDDYVRQ